MLSVHEAYRDATRQELDRALLVDLLHFPEMVLTELDLLRRQWCAEPSVYGSETKAPTLGDRNRE